VWRGSVNTRSVWTKRRNTGNNVITIPLFTRKSNTRETILNAKALEYKRVKAHESPCSYWRYATVITCESVIMCYKAMSGVMWYNWCYSDKVLTCESVIMCYKAMSLLSEEQVHRRQQRAKRRREKAFEKNEKDKVIITSLIVLCCYYV